MFKVTSKRPAGSEAGVMEATAAALAGWSLPQLRRGPGQLELVLAQSMHEGGF